MFPNTKELKMIRLAADINSHVPSQKILLKINMGQLSTK